MAESSLKDKLREAQASGSFTLGSGETTTAAEGGQRTPSVDVIQGDLKVEVPPVADSDPLLNNGSGSGAATLIKQVATAPAAATTGNIMAPSLSAIETVTITKEDRQRFLDALIAGKRYFAPFSLFGGAVRGMFRCRSAEESEAIAGWLSTVIAQKKYDTSVAYAADIRNALLAAHVEELNGTVYASLQAPLKPIQTGDTRTDVGWNSQAEYWGKQPEAMLTGLYEELRVCERKYWTMVDNAQNQDFWHPAEST